MTKEKRLIYPLELIATGLHFLFKTRHITKRDYDPMRSLIVYCLMETPEGYLPLNREYKPIGLSNYSPWVKYDQYPFLLIPKNKANVQALDNNGGGLHHFFFDDGTFPDSKKFKLKYQSVVMETFPEIRELLCCWESAHFN